jgi:hypothetical protein
MKKFLSINFSDGKIYEHSKEEKEDWEEHENTKGKISWRNYYNKGVTGVFQGIKFREWEYGDEVQVFFKDGEDQLVVAFKLLNSKGNVEDTYLVPFIQVLPNMKVGETYTLFPYNFTPDGEKYSKSGVSVKQDGERVGWALTMEYKTKDGEHHEGDIPQKVWKEDKLSGKKKPSAASLEKRDEVVKEYLSDLLDKLAVDEVKDEKPSKQEAEKP